MAGGSTPPSTIEELCAIEGIAELGAVVQWARLRAVEIVTQIDAESPLLDLLSAGAPDRVDVASRHAQRDDAELEVIEELDLEEIEELDVGDLEEDETEPVRRPSPELEQREDAQTGQPPRAPLLDPDPKPATDTSTGGTKPASATPTDAVTSAPTRGAAARRDRRYRLEQPIQVKYERWDEFIELYTKDISRGGFFVQTTDPPPLHTQVTLRMSLPGASMRDLKVTGEVIHVVTPAASSHSGMPAGFGLQLVNMTPERRRLLEIVVEHARALEHGRLEDARRASALIEQSATASSSALRLSLTDAEQRTLAELQAILEAAHASNAEALLELPPDPSPEEVRTAAALAIQRWQDAAHRPESPPEIRTLANSLLRRIEEVAEAAERANRGRPTEADAVPEPVFRDLTPIRGVPVDYPAPVSDAEHTEPGGSKRAPGPSVEPTNSEPTEAPRGGGLRRRLARLIGRPDREAEPKLEPSHPRADTSAVVDRAVQAINDKRLTEAISLLEPVLRRSPGNARVATLLRFAEARLLAKEGKIAEAIDKYEEVLRLHPNHRAAERDLTILRCLD